ncbi:MAG: LysM peptidoglycan-binding domain-containing protein [Anaerolineaceae bacterium]|nr:MAG: LysM peptidoglycan-binding domain-containing protein [Anaerolineaceae bacterium]
MSLKRLIVILPILALALTACLKQASPPVEVIAEAQQADAQQAVTIAPATETPDPDELTLITSTPAIREATDTPDPTPTQETLFTEAPPTDEPADIDEPTDQPAQQPTADDIVLITATPFTGQPTTSGAVDPVQVQATSTPFVQTTRPVITPGSPMGGESAIATPTPPAETDPEAVSTPSGLVTPTDAFFPDDPAEVPEECIYVVRRGDTLFRIALNNNTTVAEVQAINPGLNPNLIRPGQEIILPDCEAEPTAAPPAPDGQTGTSAQPVPLGGTPSAEDGGITAGIEATHVVQSGETLGAIARRYGVTINAIVARNNITNPNVLSVGQELIIPAPGG